MLLVAAWRGNPLPLDERRGGQPELQAATHLCGRCTRPFHSRLVIQKITYAKTKSHATTGLEEGPEAVYAIKAGLRTAAEKAAGGSSRLTVSGAQKKLIDEAKKAKRGRESEEEDESDDDAAPEKKKDKKDDDSGASSRTFVLQCMVTDPLCAQMRWRRSQTTTHQGQLPVPRCRRKAPSQTRSSSSRAFRQRQLQTCFRTFSNSQSLACA